MMVETAPLSEIALLLLRDGCFSHRTDWPSLEPNFLTCLLNLAAPLHELPCSG